MEIDKKREIRNRVVLNVSIGNLHAKTSFMKVNGGY